MEKKDWDFSFVIEDITAEQAEELLDMILAFTDALGTNLGGGFAPLDEALQEAEIAAIRAYKAREDPK